jgi:hypothetical protein
VILADERSISVFLNGQQAFGLHRRPQRRFLES